MQNILKQIFLEKQQEIGSGGVHVLTVIDDSWL